MPLAPCSLVRAARPALVFALLLPAPRAAAHPAAAELAATWTGLERTGGVDQTRLFSLVLELDAAAVSAPAASRGQTLTGTWTSQPVERDRKGRQSPAVVQKVTAEYFPDVGILRATRLPPTGGRGVDCLIVFDADVTRLAGVHTGALKDLTPIHAVRGGALTADLLGLTGLPRDRLVAEAAPSGPAPAAGSPELARALAEAYVAGDYARARTLLEALRPPSAAAPAAPGAPPAPTTSTAGSARDPQAAMVTLQQQMQAAAARGDVAEIKRLQQEMQKLRTEALAQRQASAGAPAPRSVPGRSTGGCPEHVVAWAAQLDAQGGSVEHFEGNNALAHLFRPRFFAPFFGTTFAALSREHRAAIGRELQSRCVMDGTPLGRGSAIGPMISAFTDAPGYNSVEAGLAGLALELIADWNVRVLMDLGAETDAARVADAELKSTQLVAQLLPREREDTRQQFAALKSRNHGRRFLAEIDSLGRAASAGQADAMARLVQLPLYADAARLSAADRAPFDAKHALVLAASTTAYLARARAEVLTVPPGLDQLIRGKAWIAVHGEALAALRAHPEVQAFQREFNAGRVASFAAEQRRMAREIAALDTWDDLARYPAPFEIIHDAELSSVWRDLDDQRRAKLAAVERREFLARTGDGPFGPDHPGAVYLNALWRGDQARLEELDRRYREPFLAQLGLLEQIDTTPDLAERLTGDTGSADRHRRLRRALLEEASLANVLLVAFAFSYETVYPSCMDADPVEFTIHVQRERSVRNLMGLHLRSVPDGVSTVTYRVNPRHAPAVADLRIADPNDTVLGETLFGRVDRQASYVHVGAGLARAMREHACDSEVIRRIEAGLLARWQTYAVRKESIQRRILGRVP